MSDSDVEIFVIYYKGVALTIKWSTVPPLERSPVVRLCSITKATEPTLLLLTADHCLYKATLGANKTTLFLDLQRNDVVDIDYCSGLQELYVVTDRGIVEKQLCNTGAYRQNRWQTVTFDPLEISEEGILIRRVCCSAEGVLFVTRRDEIYVFGSCGAIFVAEITPVKMRFFEEGKELHDVVAGDDFFVLLLGDNTALEKEDMLNLSSAVTQTSQQKPRTSQFTAVQNSLDSELTFEDLIRKQELTSRASIQSLSSKSDLSNVDTFAANIQQILNQGQRLLNTQVYTFGSNNNGVLGTGDHIKRSTVNSIHKLESIGVCSISAGREHSVARTLDGRIYHWGLNSKQQLNAKVTVSDVSTPIEIKMDNVALDAQQRSIIEVCCGDYETVLLNMGGTISTLPERQKENIDKTFLKVQFGEQVCGPPNLRLLLVSGDFTVHNIRALQTQYHNCLTNLQAQMQLLLKYSNAVRLLRTLQRKSTVDALRTLNRVCRNFQRILCLLAATLHSIEAFYRADFDNAVDLLFVQFHRECIALFENYTKSYCDIYSIDGFTEAARAFSNISTVPLMPKHNDETDLARIFQQPFQIFPVFIQFLEQLLKTRLEFKEHLMAWEAFGRQNCIYQELAVNTHEFWSSNERNTRIIHFRRKHRRVILTSSIVPLKLSHSTLSISNTTFILFSDCLCQLGSTIHTYPLCTVWVKIESDTSLRIIAPEKSITVTTKSHLDKMLWHDQLESSIVAALGRPVGSKVPNVRTTAYVFSRDHAKYPNVHAYGGWRHGVLHGNCYLEYPDGRCFYGEVHNGEIEGHGKMVIPSVGIYEGNFKAGKFHGHGVFEMKDNEIYEGNFRDGLFHGHGTLRSNHYTYIGEHQANAKSGYGVYDDQISGDKYLGMFADNKRTGAGICITMKGDYFEGMFVADELMGSGVAVLDNDYYYEGELRMQGPNGKGTYYMPNGTVKYEESTATSDDECANYQLVGNVLSGNLAGNWQEVRIQAGGMSVNRHFNKYPKSIGELIVDNNRKWRSLFDNFESEILNAVTRKTDKRNSLTTEQLWNCIAVFMHTLRARHRSTEQQEKNTLPTNRSYFAKNIMMGLSSGFERIANKTSFAKSSLSDIGAGLLAPRRIHSQENLYQNGISKSDSLHSISLTNGCGDEISFNSIYLDNSMRNSTMNSDHSSFGSALNSSVESISQNNNNNNFSSLSTQSTLDCVPSFAISSLNASDISSLKDYLNQAFNDRYHPLYLLNQRVANCFYYSYGCWKVKPTPILAKQAMREWESISKRIYKFVRKMFPALPEDYCTIESTREVVSHITLLYPFVLSEGIYSTLFVLYANKYSRKDEMYRQNINYAEKLRDNELTELLGLESSYLIVINNEHFAEAIKTLKQLQEKFSPKAMLTVIENCMQQITDAYKAAESETAALLTTDCMIPLTVFIVLRAAVTHLGAELALLGDLTGGANFQVEMNGLAGYCFTTLKASYEHVTSKPLQKTL